MNVYLDTKITLRVGAGAGDKCSLLCKKNIKISKYTNKNINQLKIIKLITYTLDLKYE